MIKVKDGYAKLIGTTTTGSASHLLLSNGGIKAVSDFAAASALDNYLPLSGGTLTGTLNTQFIRPSVDAAYQCGTSSLRWDNVYSVYGTFSTSATIAGKEVLHAGNISSYNAGSATKLQTPRTIWGQSFDGTKDINGDPIFINNTALFFKDTNGYNVNVLNFNTNNVAIFGSGTATRGYDTVIRTGNKFSIQIGSSYKDRFIIDSSGNVLIGTTTDSGYKLQVEGAMSLTRGIVSGGYTNGVYIGASYSALGDSYTGGTFYAYGANPLYFYTNNKSRMIVAANGNVGIGTLTPSAKLHSHGLVKITANGKTLTIGSQNADHCHYSTDSPCHWFNKDVMVAGHIYGGSDYNRRVAYADELHSKDAGAIEGSITNSGAYSYSSTRYGIWYQNHYSGHGLGNYRGVLSCRDSGVGFELNSYWCVNPSDSANLNNLYFRVKRDSASDWGPYSRIVTQSFSGSIYADHFYENSDATLKTNIKTINTSDNIPQLKSFDWKESGEHSYGLIAQELEEQGYSELVSTKDDGYKTVNYSAALSLIVGKLQVKIKELEKEIENLKNKN